MSAINLSLTGYKINAPRYSNKLYFVRIRLALHHIIEIDIYMCVPYKHWFYFFKLRCILCVAGTSVDNHKSNIRNNGEYFLYGENILNFVPILIMDVYKLKVYNYFNNY